MKKIINIKLEISNNDSSISLSINFGKDIDGIIRVLRSSKIIIEDDIKDNISKGGLKENDWVFFFFDIYSPIKLHIKEPFPTTLVLERSQKYFYYFNSKENSQASNNFDVKHLQDAINFLSKELLLGTNYVFKEVIVGNETIKRYSINCLSRQFDLLTKDAIIVIQKQKEIIANVDRNNFIFDLSSSEVQLRTTAELKEYSDGLFIYGQGFLNNPFLLLHELMHEFSEGHHEESDHDEFNYNFYLMSDTDVKLDLIYDLKDFGYRSINQKGKNELIPLGENAIIFKDHTAPFYNEDILTDIKKKDQLIIDELINDKFQKYITAYNDEINVNPYKYPEYLRKFNRELDQNGEIII